MGEPKDIPPDPDEDEEPYEKDDSESDEVGIDTDEK